MVSTIITVIDGNVGIGTNDPSSSFGLDVHGDTKFGDLVCDDLSGSDIGSSAFVPSGMIAIWSGSEANIPTGWVICDGTNGTPNLGNKYILGAGISFNVGQSRDANTAPYGVPNIPKHTHATFKSQKGDHNHNMENAFAHTHNFKEMNHSHTDSVSNTQHNHQTGSRGNHTHGTNSGGAHGHPLVINDTRYAGNAPFSGGASWTAMNNSASNSISITRNVNPVNHQHSSTINTHNHTVNASNHQHSSKTAAGHQHNTNQVGGHVHTNPVNESHQHNLTVADVGATPTTVFNLAISLPNMRIYFIMKL